MNNEYLDKQGNLIDYYSIFNLPYNARENEIKAAFRALIKRYHPDTAETNQMYSTEIIDLIIQGYKILVDSTARFEYDKVLLHTESSSSPIFPVIPEKRVKYSASLTEMLKVRFLPKRISRKDILLNFGQDIEILITPTEAKRGAIAYITLPARMHCPYCSGRNPQCHVCKGIGRISTTSQLQITIPPNVMNNTMIDIELVKLKPGRLTSFRNRSIRIKITILKK